MGALDNSEEMNFRTQRTALEDTVLSCPFLDRHSERSFRTFKVENVPTHILARSVFSYFKSFRKHHEIFANTADAHRQLVVLGYFGSRITITIECIGTVRRTRI